MTPMPLRGTGAEVRRTGVSPRIAGSGADPAVVNKSQRAKSASSLPNRNPVPAQVEAGGLVFPGDNL